MIFGYIFFDCNKKPMTCEHLKVNDCIFSYMRVTYLMSQCGVITSKEEEK